MVMAIVVGFLLVLGALGYYVLFYDAPSCTDRRQNQDEEGIDCGGVCSRLCAANLAIPQVAFARSVSSGPGRTDVVAYIDNPNGSAKAEARYTIELFDANNAVVASKDGTIDLPPKRTPLYVPNFFSGEETDLRAFLTIDEASLAWFAYEDTRVTLSVEDVVVEHVDTLPRVRAVLRNPSIENFRNVRVVITVFDADNNAIAASETLVRELRAEGEAALVFTWNAPFAEAPARQEIIPVVPEAS